MTFQELRGIASELPESLNRREGVTPACAILPSFGRLLGAFILKMTHNFRDVTVVQIEEQIYERMIASTAILRVHSI